MLTSVRLSQINLHEFLLMNILILTYLLNILKSEIRGRPSINYVVSVEGRPTDDLLQTLLLKMADSKNWVFQPPTKAEKLSPKFHRLVLGLVGLNDAKGINVTQPMWPSGCPMQSPKRAKNTKNAILFKLQIIVAANITSTGELESTILTKKSSGDGVNSGIPY